MPRAPKKLPPADDPTLDAPDPDAEASAADEPGTEGEAAPRLTRSQRPSRTQRKNQSQDLQELGEELAALPAHRLDAAPMPDILRDAFAELRRTRSFEGKRRQMQYIGKLMRRADPEPLREAVAAFKLPSAEETLRLHQAEAWREQLIADDDALTRWAADFPRSDLQQLRSLIRAARKEALLPLDRRQPRPYRELFQFIKPLLAGQE
jgi:ribosome-associated protein